MTDRSNELIWIQQCVIQTTMISNLRYDSIYGLTPVYRNLAVSYYYYYFLIQLCRGILLIQLVIINTTIPS